MRLLLVTQDFPPDVGGTQTYAAELAWRLASRCDDFAVIAPRRPGAAATDRALPYRVVRAGTSYNALSAAALFPLLLLAKRDGFDTAFHVQWPTALSALLARRLGALRRVFIAAHGRELLLKPLAHLSPLGSLYDGARGYALRHADGLLPVSRYTGGLLETLGAAPRRMDVVHNGTDPERFKPLDATALKRALGIEAKRVVLTIGRLVPRKGIDTVLRAFPEVLRAVPDAVYLIGGIGPDRERLAAIAQEMGVGADVRFLGKIPYSRLPLYYNACDVFVMPSRAAVPDVEGFGIVFLEAGACGKPVVGARAGGVPDAVRDGETGLLIEPDVPPALAGTLIRLLQDESLARQMGAAGRRRVLREGTWDHAADQVYRFIATQSP